MSNSVVTFVENTSFITEPDGSFTAFVSDRQRLNAPAGITTQMVLAAIHAYFVPRVGPVQVTWYDDLPRNGTVVNVRPLNIERTQNLTG